MDLILAFSLQDQVEKYGAYVGLAAFLGLAVLSLLYFAQARELKRLRDWAGRAPERAVEVEARVVAQAEEALREPEPAAEPSGTVGPAVPVAKPAPASGNGRREGVPVPMGPRPAVAMAALAASTGQATVEAPAVVEEEEAAPSGEDGATTAPPVDGDAPGDGDRPAEPADEEQPAEPEPAPSGNGVPAEPPAQIPRATPRPQPKPMPRPEPAAAPLRAATSTRAVTVPPRRTIATPRSAQRGGSRAGLYTLIGIVVLAAAIFVPVYFMVLSGDDPAPPPNPVADPGASPTAGGSSERVADARPEKVVVVLNGTVIPGLAADFRDELVAAGYSEEPGMIRVDDNDDQQRQDSIVYYEAAERRQARDVSRLLDITRTEEIDEETQALADSSDETGDLPADVVVILGADKSP